MENKQILARNMIVDVEDKQSGNLKIAGNPIKMTNLPEVEHRNPAPEIGEHNSEIFKNMLGYDDEMIEKLKKDGVI